MKKLLICFVALAMLVSGSLSVLASEGKVEISFCVGDDTLIINGAAVTVEKPYIVGTGVTLVPVRVITEAFDAKVDWIGETQTVKLTYPDVNIVIQIGNPVAEVNGRAETLLAPPELTEAGYTMVPLRFISENFGADVSYDNDTKRITVIKEKTTDSAVSIEGTVNSKYIGDSFLKWSMENPTDMVMEHRSFDGMENIFSDGENEISIEVFIYDEEDYDFESEYNEIKMSMSEYTLVKTEKNTDDKNCKNFHFGIKDKMSYYDYQQFVTPEYIYVVSGLFSNENTKLRDQYLNLLSTFKCEFQNADIYDLANIKDGFKKYESEHLKLSFNVPENFYMASSEDAENKFEFYEMENSISSIIAVVYSKSDVGSANALAAEDFEHNKQVLNENLATFSNSIIEKQYENISAIEYSYTVKSEKMAYHKRDVFFEIGDYVYNVAVSIELPCDNYNEYIDKIIQSIEAEPLDSKEVGVFMKNVPAATGTTKAKLGKATISLPNIYVNLSTDDSSMTYVGGVNGVFVACMKVPATDASTSDLKKIMKSAETELKQEDAVILKPVHEKVINNQKYQAFQAKAIEDEEYVYLEEFACTYKGYVYIFFVSCSEIMYSESAQEEISNIIESIKFE